MHKKILSVLIATLMIMQLFGFSSPAYAEVPPADAWSAYAEEFVEGDGLSYDDEGTPFQIETAAQLAYLAQQVNSGEDYNGVYFELASDVIDLSAHEWVPIGDSDHPFNGHFDGQGNTVSGMRIGAADSANNTYAYAGLFGYAGEESYISEVDVAGDIYSSYSYEGSGEDDACVGLLTGYSEGHIRDCAVEGTIMGADTENAKLYLGGLAGYNAGTYIEDSDADVNIDVTGGFENFDGYVGGFVGGSEGTIIGCSAVGEVSVGGLSGEVTGAAGGFIGWNKAVIDSCSASGGVAGGFAAYLGGFTGYNDRALIYNSSATGAVLGGHYASIGGFVGRAEGAGGLGTSQWNSRIYNCYATGDVAGAEETEETSYVGGFAGSSASATFLNCYAAGAASGDGVDVHGFFGWLDEAYDGLSSDGNFLWLCYYLRDASSLTGTDDYAVGYLDDEEGGLNSDAFVADSLNYNLDSSDIMADTLAATSDNALTFSRWTRDTDENDGYPTLAGEPLETPFDPISTTELTIGNNETVGDYIASGSTILDPDNSTAADIYNNITIDASIGENMYGIFGADVFGYVQNPPEGETAYSIFEIYEGSGSEAEPVSPIADGYYLIIFNPNDVSEYKTYYILLDDGGGVSDTVLNKGKLRFGDGTEDSINDKGGLQQPFYYNQTSSLWRKLTFGEYPLNYAVAVGGANNGAWNAAGIDNAAVDEIWTDLEVDYSGISDGAGTAEALGTVTVDGHDLEFTNHYELQEDSSFVKITSTVRNPGDETVANVRYWTGTQDDYVGGSDSPTKTKGNLAEGAFSANTAEDQQARALKIESGTETVLFFSTHPKTEMIIFDTLSFAGLINTNPRDNYIFHQDDDSYGMYVNLGDLNSGESSSFTWYYAAGAAADIGEIIGDVGEEAGDELSSDSSLSNMISSTGTLSPAFASGTTSYTISVGNAVSSMTITPTVNDNSATVTVNGQTVDSGQASQSIPLSVGSNTVQIRVTAEDESETLYTVTVTRAAAPVGGGGGGATPQPSQGTVIVIVNGEPQNAGTETKSTEAGKSVVTVAVDNKVIESRIESAIKENTTGNVNVVQVLVSDTKSEVAKVELTGDIVKKLETNTFDVSIKWDNVEYVIPAEEFTISKIAENLGVQEKDLNDIKIEVKITKLDQSVVEKYNEVAKASGAELVFPPVSFEVVAKTVKTDGTTGEVGINKFSNYVERVMEIPAGVDPSKITTGIVFNPDGTYSHVPTDVFQKDGKWYAKLNSLTNSNYSVIWNPITVKSVENHWAKDAVNDMASRLVIFDPEKFEPNKAITRADFAEYIVRALGLYREGSEHHNKFTDVSATGDRTMAILIANEYGIVTGYTDGTFKPDQQITREEAMVMYQRAMKVTKLTGYDTTRYQNYADFTKVSGWAQLYVKTVLSAHVFNGTSATTISPKSNLTYAESAQAIKNLLVESKLINE